GMQSLFANEPPAESAPTLPFDDSSVESFPADPPTTNQPVATPPAANRSVPIEQSTLPLTTSDSAIEIPDFSSPGSFTEDPPSNINQRTAPRGSSVTSTPGTTGNIPARPAGGSTSSGSFAGSIRPAAGRSAPVTDGALIEAATEETPFFTEDLNNRSVTTPRSNSTTPPAANGSRPRTSVAGAEADPQNPAFDVNDRNFSRNVPAPTLTDDDFPPLPPVQFGNNRADSQNGSSNDPGTSRQGLSGRGSGLSVPASDEINSNRPSGQASSVRTASGSVSEVLRPHLAISKQAPRSATVGVPLDYVIEVRNEGESVANAVIVEDEVPSGAKYVRSEPAATFDSATGKLTWEFAELEATETRQIKVTIEPTGEGTLSGVATVRFRATVSSSTVITAPRLSLDVDGPAEARIGDEVTFRFTIRNQGSGSAQNVILRNVLPEGLTHPEGQDLEYEITELPAGDVRQIELSVVAVKDGVFSNSALVTGPGDTQAQGAAEIRIIGSQLTVERMGPARRYVGRSGQYRNIVTNDTNFDATNAWVYERVPQGMSFVSAGQGGVYDNATRTISWPIDRLGPGQQAVLDVELVAEVAQDMETVVEVVEGAGYRAQARHTVAIEDIHNVSADVSRISGPVSVGERFGFQISIDNRGTAVATDVSVSITVPKEIEVIAAGAGSISGRMRPGNVVQYSTVVRIQPDEKVVFPLTLRGSRAASNVAIVARMTYAEMKEPLVVSESVTVIADDL
ncbi:MAG: OmcB family cysteine-rich outer membrane protein, partial [Planctomycetaceae bacterium]|nr:OmcB family cysteine-rich outer membrane protein [Planctomycetaceae bacterium]